MDIVSRTPFTLKLIQRFPGYKESVGSKLDVYKRQAEGCLKESRIRHSIGVANFLFAYAKSHDWSKEEDVYKRQRRKKKSIQM